MSNKPIFVVTHPRACSTAFERVFMTCRDTLKCIHEPFGDAFYYGPERLSSRFEEDEKARLTTGFSESTYKTIIDRFEKEGGEGKRLLIKDMAYYLAPPDGAPPSIAPSLDRKERGVGTVAKPHPNHALHSIPNGVTDGVREAPYPYATEPEPGNPTIVPTGILEKFHFTFLIRHPRSSIPSYYRCTVPPLDKLTGFYDFMPNEAGYQELRRLFDYLRSVGLVGPGIASRIPAAADRNGYTMTNGHATTNGSTITNGYATTNGSTMTNGHSAKVEICVVDADDLLDNPNGVIEVFCKSVGIEYNDRMLNWESEEDQQYARETFAKWPGFHEDALNSCDLKPRTHKKKVKTQEEEDTEWREKFGEKAAKVIRETVDANIEDYEYLKQFALKV